MFVMCTWLVGLLAACTGSSALQAPSSSASAQSLSPVVTRVAAAVPVASAASPAPVAARATSAAPVPPASPAPVFGRGSVSIQTKTGAVTLAVNIADDEAKREYGLMNRRSLPADEGMLFVFDPPASAQQVGFWMKDTLIPLSIAFVEPNLVVESLDEMEAQSEQVHYAPRDYAYALEANQGYFTRHGVAPGDKVRLSYAIVPASSG
jgi:uncharacterized protein